MTEESLALPIELLGSIERYAVYRCYSDSGQLLYVGETGDLGKRLADHASKLWFVQVRGITLEWYADELEALKAERRAIHVEHPKHNKVHRQTTSAQVARIRPRKVAKRNGRMARSRMSPEAARSEALAIIAAEPGIKGKDLGPRVGRSERWGQDFKNNLAITAPKGQDPEESP